MRDFLNTTPDRTCGHEEIELALIRLYRVTGKEEYLELARQFVERRGRIPFFPLHLLRQFKSFNKRKAYVNELRQSYIAEHPEHASFRLPGDNYTKDLVLAGRARYLNALGGRYAEQHTPIRKQTVPVGHSVRFGYLETAIAMLLRAEPDEYLLSALEQAWERMVTKRMYITGGLGAVPGLKASGRLRT